MSGILGLVEFVEVNGLEDGLQQVQDQRLVIDEEQVDCGVDEMERMMLHDLNIQL